MSRLMVSLRVMLMLLSGIILSSCGSSDSDDSGAATSTLSGTAAVGLALSNRVVTVVDSTGAEVTTTTASDGTYSVKVTTSANPFMLKVETDGDPLFSFAAQSGIANITPLTNLALHEASKNGKTYKPLASLFSAFKDNYADITETELLQAKAKVNATIASLLSAEGLDNAVDFFSTAFSANGAGIDAVLDAVNIVIGNGGSAADITITLGGAAAFAFNPDISFAGFLPGAGDSGGAGSTGTEGCSVRSTAYSSLEDLLADIKGDYVVTSITGGGGSNQTSIESYGYVEININNSNISVKACQTGLEDSSTCASQIQYGGSLSWSGITSELLANESNIYFDYSASSLLSNVYYDHATCELTVETRSTASLTNWAALHHDPSAVSSENPGSGSGLAGTWDLTISGTVGGFNIPADITIPDFPANAVPTATNAGESEAAFNQSFGAVGNVSNYSYNVVSSSATQVIVNVTATVTTPAQEVQGFSIPGQVFNYDLTYTYNKQ